MSPDTPKEQARGRLLRRGGEGCVTRGMVLKLHLQKSLLFTEAVLGVCLTRGTLMKIRGSWTPLQATFWHH